MKLFRWTPSFSTPEDRSISIVVDGSDPRSKDTPSGKPFILIEIVLPESETGLT